MKAIISLVVVFMCAQLSNAANVTWNSIEVDSLYPGGYGITYPCITMTGTVVGDVLTLWADAYDYMELSSSWVLANKGDIASIAEVQKNSSFFYSADFNDGEEIGNVHTDYSIAIKAGESVYLSLISRTYTSAENYDVGWVELSYGTDGELIVIASALDSDGGALVVGATPEPTSAVLVLMGVAVLSLKRKFGGAS